MYCKLDTHHSKGFLPVSWANLYTAVPLGVDQWRWNVPFQRLVQREKHFLLPTLVLLAGFLLSFRTKSLMLSFSHLVLRSSKTSILASWLELKCFSVYCCTAPNPCKPSFLLLVTSPTVARDTQCLNIQGLALVNEECFVLDECEICLLCSQTFLFQAAETISSQISADPEAVCQKASLML